MLIKNDENVIPGIKLKITEDKHASFMLSVISFVDKKTNIEDKK